MKQNKMKKIKQIIPLTFVVYFSTTAILIFCGLADSIYLTISHYRNYTDLAYKSFCAVSKALNCDTVAQSPYSVFFGVPLAVWGIIGYIFLSLFLIFIWGKRDEKKRIWTLLYVFSIIFSIISIVLAIASTVYIHSYCIMCVGIFGINFLLMYFTWLIRRRYGASSFIEELKQDGKYFWKVKKKSAVFFLPFLVCVIAVIIFLPHYWEFKVPVGYYNLTVGITDDGHPWIGAEHPVLEITEFTDYLCFPCNKMHFYLRQLIMENPGKIRLIHRHFPMDHKYNFTVRAPFYEGTGELALVAIYATTKGKFLEMNDLLFSLARKRKPIKIKELADKVKLDYRELRASLHNKEIFDMLGIDIWDGYKLGITGTPAYVIDGKVYQGNIPPEIIRRAIEE